MRNRYLLLLGALAFLCPILLQPLHLSGMQGPPQLLTLRGTVTRAGTSEPIPDVQVSIGSGRGNFNTQSLQSLQQTIATATVAGIQIPAVLQAQLETQQAALRGGPNAPIQLNATSDRDGHFVFRDLQPGQYAVRAEREGYFGAYLNAVTTGSPPTFVQTTLNLAAGQPLPDLSLSLTPGGAISGTATDSEGRPVVAAAVQAYRLNYQNGYPILQAGAITSTTDDRGAYRIFRIPPGDYYLEVTPGARGGFAGLNRGGVASKQGLVRTFYPDAMDAKNARVITLRGGEDMTGTAIAVRTSPLINISGQIVSTVPLPTRAGPRGNSIIQGPALILVPHDPGALEVGGARQAGNATMDTPTTGQFQLTGIAPGSYDLYARLINANATAGARGIDIGGFGGAAAPATPPAEPIYYFGRTSIEAGFQDVQGISLAMSGGVEMKVFVTVDGSAAEAAGNVRLALTSADSSRFFPVYANAVAAAQMLAGPDGSITIPFVYEGTYRFQANINPSNGTNVAANPARAAGARGQRGAPAGPSFRDAYVEDIREGGLSVYDNGLTVGKQSPRPIEVIVKTNGGVIEGDVYDTQQQLKPGAAIVLAPAQARRQNSALYKTTQSNAMGHFTLRAIPPGQYKLFAFESVMNGAYQDPAFIGKYEERGRAVTVNATSTTSAQVTVIPTGK